MAPKTDAEKAAAEKEKRKEQLSRTQYTAEAINYEHAIPMSEFHTALDKELKADIEEWFNGDVPAGVRAGFSEEGISDEARVALTRNFTKLNQLKPRKQKPEWLKFLEQLTGFFSLLLWFGAILCFFGYGLKADIDNLYLGIVLSSVVLITGIFSYLQDSKSASLMAEFSKMMAQEVLVKVPGVSGEGFQKIPSTHLVRGDIVKLESGDKVPADIRVSMSKDLRVNNAPLTGEPDALERTVKCTNKDEPQETFNLCFFGTNIEMGYGYGIVRAVGDDTFIGKVAALTEDTENVETPINREIHHFITIVSGVAIFLGVSFFIVGAALGTDFITNLVFMIGIIVANVPEGLLATVTVCLTLTSKSMAKKMVLVKNMEGVETLGSTTCICSDKTGTLTMNVMTFANLVYNNKTFRTDFVDDKLTPAVERTDPTFVEFLKAMKLNSTATFDPESLVKKDPRNPSKVDEVDLFLDVNGVAQVLWQTRGDASESSIIKFAQYMTGDKPDDARYNREDEMVKARQHFEQPAEIPFNSSNKYHLVVRKSNDPADAEFPNTVYMKGAPDRILTRCDEIIIDGRVEPFTDERRAELAEEMDTLMEKGRRVLGFAMKRLPVAEYPADYPFDAKTAFNFPMGEEGDDPRRATKLTFIGLAALIDPPRPAVPGAVLDCQTAGIRVVMVTGDHPKTAKAIAQMVNIIGADSRTEEEIFAHNTLNNLKQGDEGWEEPNLAKAIVVPGHTISPDTTDEKWKFIFAHDEIVFARTSPAQKLMIVEKFQQFEKEIVAVTGDGVNDAPALKKADIGVAMGITGTEVSKSAADMILLDDNFASIVAGVEEGRLIFDNLKKSIAYTLSSNIPEISPFLIFITVNTPLPLSTVLILCIDLGTDMVPAISMAWENAENDIMKRPARDSSVDRLVTRKLVVFAYLQIGMIQAAAGFFTWMVVLNDYGYPPTVLAGLGTFDNWGRQVLYCKLSGGVFRNIDGVAFDATGSTARDAVQSGYMFWDPVSNGVVELCDYAAKNYMADPDSVNAANIVASNPSTFVGSTAGERTATLQSIEALLDDGFIEYSPWRGRMSPFFDKAWLAWDVREAGPPGMGTGVDATLLFNSQNPGVWNVDVSAGFTADSSNGNSGALQLVKAKIGSDNIAAAATFLQSKAIDPSLSAAEQAQVAADNEIAHRFGYTDVDSEGNLVVNIASRMMQKEALHHAQCAYFVSIVVVQWADLMICKTRWLSIRQQGMRNPAMNFGLVFETILGAWICYLPGLSDAVGTRPIQFLHWVPAVPFSVCIFLYDEVRKSIMRATSPPMQVGKQIIRDYGWMARQTYY